LLPEGKEEAAKGGGGGDDLGRRWMEVHGSGRAWTRHVRFRGTARHRAPKHAGPRRWARPGEWNGLIRFWRNFGTSIPRSQRPGIISMKTGGEASTNFHE
jgi:hypothetical protein